MPDLTVEGAWTCATNVHYETEVSGSHGGSYRVWWGRLSPSRANREYCLYGWHCECPGFRYRHTCRHVKEAEKERCGWNACLEPTLEAGRDSSGEPCCPECGGPVEAYRVAV